MRVLVVSQYFWPEGFRINDVVLTLVEKGVEVDVLTGKPNYPEGAFFKGYRGWGSQVEAWGGATVFRVPLFPRGSRSAWRLAVNYLSFVVTGMIYGPWLLRKRQYDVIFVYGLSPILLAIPAVVLSWIKRRRLIVWVQDLWPDSLAATGYVRSPRVLHAVKWVVRWIYRHTDLFLVQSRAFHAPVAELAPGKPVMYFPNSVDVAFCEPPAAGIDLPMVPAMNEGFPVVFAGNVGAGQAVEVLVNAAELLKSYPDIQVVVFGQGSRWDWMREQVQVRGLTNLHMPGRFPVSTMPALMQKASALLVTLADEPIFAATVPSKVQAYMAAGRPILACLNGEGARLVEEAGAGLTVPAEDARGLADAVLQLYRMRPEERAEMGANGRRYFKEHFDHEKLVEQLIVHFSTQSAESGNPV
ncbi:MAG: glycosyltransferase family 4 protein [Polaromonas sp.]|uniref:glycosyltransferase family 4 protein n=1 Tax=Polaromonas sp. TaxID=1869339 RepID=UPI00185A86B5|nr:glycosyltransferase family 4 protein [Polaromonas sp.]MBA3594803.1 glycosyltransferase family 4 protein [Polaromonas sp.]